MIKQTAICFVLALWGGSTHAQNVNSTKPKGAGDLIESTSYNDDKRGLPRTIQYLPEGEDFVCVNGKNRYTRALYGSPTAWRIETSDRPIFATYKKGANRNIRFVIRMADGHIVELENTSWCKAIYTPGRRSYKLTDKSWGTADTLSVAVLADNETEQAVWKFTGNVPKGSVLEAILSPIRQPKLMRSGDMGADPPGCFDPSGDGKVLQRLTLPIINNGETYVAIVKDSLSTNVKAANFDRMEAARKALAGRVKVDTPDPWLNTLGGAIAVAADGIWGEEGVWLHGAIGWRMPLSGWRAAYTGDALGWHDRARTHFDNYAASQVTDVKPVLPHPAQDSTLALARAVKKWGTPMYSEGYICRNPRRPNQMHHYDMNLCYIDELLWHLNWTGDLGYARSMWPVIKRHLQWEKRNFDPDGDGLYDAYACIWASDALYYNSGAVTHSTAYNYRANRMAAMIAGFIGEDATPYKAEADKILEALNSRLWLKNKGHWAEFQDFMGHKRVHEDAALWTIYHAIDSDVADPFQAYSAIGYVENNIPHIPVTAVYDEQNATGDVQWDALRRAATNEVNAGQYATVSETDWMPYAWSINNVAFAEVMHTALACFQAGRTDVGYRLMKSSFLDGMYLGDSPGNFGQISYYDAARGECYRDFGDPIGVASRLLVQGLFGVIPDALNGRLTLRPGFPKDWKHASLHTPDIDFSFKDSTDRLTEYIVAHRLNHVNDVELCFPARMNKVVSVNINGKAAQWSMEDNSVERPMLAIKTDAQAGETLHIIVKWGGSKLTNSPVVSSDAVASAQQQGSYRFVKVNDGDLSWYHPIVNKEANSQAKSVYMGAFEHVNASKCVMVDMKKSFNADVKDVFKNKYLSPRSPYTTLQMPVQGIGEWCHPLQTATIDDAGLREKAAKGMIKTPQGIPFKTPALGQNIAFTTLWDNYPDSLTVPLKGRAERVYLLMAGTTNHMQSRIENGRVRVYYRDGSSDVMSLVNPDNWPPIEQLFFEDGLAFNRKAPSLWRLDLKTGEIGNNFGQTRGYKAINRPLEGGGAVLLDMPLNPEKKLKSLVLETVSNDVVIGIMAVTLQQP